MTKNTNIVILFVVIFLVIGVFTFFYYVKPQREYLAKNTEVCVNNAMKPINSEVAKTDPNPYKTRDGFWVMQQTQDNELNKCIKNYYSILFSQPELDILIMNIKNLNDKQAEQIKAYIKKVEDKQVAIATATAKQQAYNKAVQDEKDNCLKAQSEFEDYNKCVDEETAKAQEESQKAMAKDYDTWLKSINSSAGMTNSNNILSNCLKLHNYKQYNGDSMTCMFMGVFVY